MADLPLPSTLSVASGTAVENQPAARGASYRPLGLLRQVFAGLAWLGRAVFGLLTLVVGLAILAALPIVQFFALGYLLDAAGRTARSGRLRDALTGVMPAARIGGVALALWIWSLPLRLLIDWRKDALVVDPRATSAKVVTALAVAALVVCGFQTLCALARGGRFSHFFRPISNLRWLYRIVRGRADTSGAIRPRLHISPAELWRSFVLGCAGFALAFAWLVIPSALLAAGRSHPLLGIVGAGAMMLVLLYVPFLLVHLAVERRWQAGLELRAVRARFASAPVAFAAALVATVVLALPLHLLKIERLPADVVWLPAVLFIVTMAPVKLGWGWAYARGSRGRRRAFWLTWPCRVAMLAAAGLYVLVLFFTQYTTWDGAAGIFEHHAFLLPVPFY